MANLTKKERKRLQDLRDDFEVLPGYADILRKAAVHDWDTLETLEAITHSRVFRRQFPGLMQQGGIADFLSGKAGATLTLQNLAGAIDRYKTFEKSYQDAMRDFPGTIGGKLTRDRLATLIRQEKSPDEFRANLAALYKVKANPDLFAAWERAAKEAGLGAKWNPFKAAAGSADQKLYDVYEAARLDQMGLGLNAADTRAVAQSLTNIDEAGNIVANSDARLLELVQQVRAQQTDIGPELRAAGVSALDLSKFVADPAGNPDLTQKIQSALAAKRGRGQYVAGSQVRGGPGGATQYDPSGAASYG